MGIYLFRGGYKPSPLRLKVEGMSPCLVFAVKRCAPGFRRYYV